MSRKAVQISPRDARIWNVQGSLYSAMGRFNDAIGSFAKAVELAPRLVVYHESLAVGYSAIERFDESRRELAAARQLATGAEGDLINVYEAAISGDTQKSLKLLAAILDTKRASRVNVRRDPNIALLFEASQVEGVLN